MKTSFVWNQFTLWPGRCGIAVGFLCLATAAGGAANLVLENADVSYTIGTDGKNLGFAAKASRRDYLRREPASACALVRRNGREFPAPSAALSPSLGRGGLWCWWRFLKFPHGNIPDELGELHGIAGTLGALRHGPSMPCRALGVESVG